MKTTKAKAKGKNRGKTESQASTTAQLEGQADPATERAEQPIETFFGTAESKTPGRTRIRIKRDLRSPDALARIETQLSKHEDVTDVAINARTGSIVIKHDVGRDGHDVFKEAMKDVELVGGLLLDVPAADNDDAGGGEYGKLDQTLADLVYKVDKAVYRRTGLRFRGQILAGTVAGAGLLQIVLFGISLEMLPGPVLLYIAYDIYHRENKEPPLDAPDTDVPAAAASELDVGAAVPAAA